MRFAVEIVKAIRAEIGEKFIICFRLSLLDLVHDGNTMQEVITVAKALEKAGITLLNTGIGWHEARIPTIVTSVPRAAFVDYTAEVKSMLLFQSLHRTGLICQKLLKRFWHRVRQIWCNGTPTIGRCILGE